MTSYIQNTIASDLRQVYTFRSGCFLISVEYKFSLRCCLMNLPNPSDVICFSNTLIFEIRQNKKCVHDPPWLISDEFIDCGHDAVWFQISLIFIMWCHLISGEFIYSAHAAVWSQMSLHAEARRMRRVSAQPSPHPMHFSHGHGWKLGLRLLSALGYLHFPARSLQPDRNIMETSHFLYRWTVRTSCVSELYQH